MFKLPPQVWIPSPNYSSRGGQKVRLIVVHDCEGSAQGAASWFAQARSRVSAQWVLWENCTQLANMVKAGNKAWHACDFNSVSEGIEMGGFEAKGFGIDEWQMMANVVAWRLKANGLPATWAKGGDGAGFASHRDLGQRGGGHTDPTTDATIWAHFCELVTVAYADAHGDTIVAKPALPPSAPTDWKPHGTVRHDYPVGSLEWAQLELNALGFGRPLLSVDGMEGNATEAALRRFQTSASLSNDGILGPLTVAALDAASKAQQAS